MDTSQMLLVRALLAAMIVTTTRAWVALPWNPPAHSRALRAPLQPARGACQRPRSLRIPAGPAGGAMLLPRPPLRMAAGGAESDAVLKAEAALDEAIAEGDVNTISKCIKALEDLQGEAAGAAPFKKQKIRAGEAGEAVQEILGASDDEAPDDVADALTTTALEDMAREIQVAEASIEWAIQSSDTAAISNAMRHLGELQEVLGGFSKSAAFNAKAMMWPDDVSRDLSEALELAALDEKLDADDADAQGVDLLEEPLADFLGSVDDAELAKAAAGLELEVAIANSDEQVRGLIERERKREEGEREREREREREGERERKRKRKRERECVCV